MKDFILKTFETGRHPVLREQRWDDGVLLSSFCISNSKLESTGSSDHWSWNYVFSVSHEITFTIRKIAFVLVLGSSKNFYAENSAVQDPNEHTKAYIDYIHVCVLADFWNGVSEGLKLSLCSEPAVRPMAWEWARESQLLRLLAGSCCCCPGRWRETASPRQPHTRLEILPVRLLLWLTRDTEVIV